MKYDIFKIKHLHLWYKNKLPKKYIGTYVKVKKANITCIVNEINNFQLMQFLECKLAKKKVC